MRHLAASLLLLACACTPGTTGGGSSGSSPGGGSSVQSGYRRVYHALCAYLDRCQATLGPAYSSLEACKKVVDVEVALAHAQFLEMDTIYAVDAAALSACESGLAQAPCADRGPPELLGCQDALAPRSPRDPGETCSLQGEPNAPSCAQSSTNRCKDDGSGNRCGVCAALVATGGACTTNEECVTGYCDGTHHCASLPSGKAVGDGCWDSAECRGSLVCAGGFMQKKCSARAPAGGTCSPERNGEHPNCVQDLTCVGGTCALPLADGQTCNRAAAGQPGCAGACTFTSPTAEQGTCRTPGSLPGADDPCAVRSVNNTVSWVCDADLYQEVSTNPDGCACRSRLPGGSRCQDNNACQTLSCEGGSPGVCLAPLEDGASCASDDECVSGFCSSRSPRACKTRPACP
jgi:hypothetical protein